MKYRLFLSHSAADAKWVGWISENCRGIGVETYLYEHDEQPGQPLGDKLQAAIRDSDAVVVLLTHESQFSPYVQQEVGFAKGLQKPIVPLVQPGIDQRALAMLTGVEYIAFDYEHPARGLASLLKYLHRAKLGHEQAQALAAVGAVVEVAAHAKLTPSEVEILRLTPDDGRIVILDFQLGKALLLGPNSLPDLNSYDPETAAHALDGLESLIRHGLVRFEGGELYRLTGKGFNARKSVIAK